LDHMMPSMDGIDTLKKIRKMNGEYYQNVPIVAFTANAVTGVKEMLIKEGFQGFISKPIDIEALEESLVKFLPANLITYDSDDIISEEENDEASFYIENVNVKKGVNYCGGKFENYIEILKDFCKDIPVRASYLKKLAQEKDLKNYQIDAHAIKSVCASIGAQDISDEAKKHEYAAKDSDEEFIIANVDDFTENLSHLVKTIKNQLIKYNFVTEKAAAYEMKKDIDKDKLKESVAAAIDCINKFNEQECEGILEEILSYRIEHYVNVRLEEALANVRDFEYDIAEEILSEVLSSL
ncbi:MAG: response regulator, partial [Firmicutes bacterium]|nr:response regulator [Bacillota bacterium]